MRLLFALLFLVSLTSCSITADVYPVAGPLSVQVPLPVLKARVNGVTSNSGTITLTLTRRYRETRRVRLHRRSRASP
jgi:hypothetical protein